MTERSVRIPCTEPRRRDTHAKLLCRVDQDALWGGGFDGMLVRPGTVLPESALRPGSEYPANPVLLECAGAVRPGRGHRRSECLWILWLFDRERWEWRELARSYSADWTWAVDLRAIAVRALREQRNQPDLAAVAERAWASIEAELVSLEKPERFRVLSTLDRCIASRMVEVAC